MTRCVYELDIENQLVQRLAEAGHFPLKFYSPGQPGVPDRLVLLKGGGVVLVEVKRPGDGRLRRAQPAMVQFLRDLGHRVEIIDTFAKVDQLIAELA